MNQLKQAILDFVSNNTSDSSAGFELAVLTVSSVDIERRVLDAVDANSHTFRSLHLQFVGASIFIVPAVGSSILACINHNLSVGFVISCSLIESAEIVIDKTAAVIDADGLRINTDQISAHFNKTDIIFNGGDLNGLIIIQKLTDKLNELKDTVNDLITKYNGHIHATTATVGASATPGVLTATQSTASPAKAFNKADYENTKIKQ